MIGNGVAVSLGNASTEVGAGVAVIGIGDGSAVGVMVAAGILVGTLA